MKSLFGVAWGLMAASSLLAANLWAASPHPERSFVRRDGSYEQLLRWQASADQSITPSKVLRWLRGMTEAQIFSAPSPAEFQPIVNVHNTRVRVIAAIAFKF